MPELSLRIATSQDYDHTRDMVNGVVSISGVKSVDWPRVPLLEVFARRGEWDLAEASFGKYCELVDNGDVSLTAVPVFQSRAFRHTAFYVRADSPLTQLSELSGQRVGVPDWSQTAVVYARGMLAHDYGVDLASIEWVQGGVNRPAVNEFMRIPDGFRVSIEAERSLSDRLLEGSIDALISAVSPCGFCLKGDGKIRWLCADPFGDERAYYDRTGSYPIMHVLVGRTEIFDAHPGLSAAITTAFEQAARNSLDRLSSLTQPYLPLPWMPQFVAAVQDTLGEECWPYGVDANRRSIEPFLAYLQEQGVCNRLLTPEELFS